MPDICLARFGTLKHLQKLFPQTIQTRPKIPWHQLLQWRYFSCSATMNCKLPCAAPSAAAQCCAHWPRQATGEEHFLLTASYITLGDKMLPWPATLKSLTGLSFDCSVVSRQCYIFSYWCRELWKHYGHCVCSSREVANSNSPGLWVFLRNW